MSVDPEILKQMIMTIAIKIPVADEDGFSVRWVKHRAVRVNLTGNPIPSNRSMQAMAYATKMEYARQIRREKREARAEARKKKRAHG